MYLLVFIVHMCIRHNNKYGSVFLLPNFTLGNMTMQYSITVVVIFICHSWDGHGSIAMSVLLLCMCILP